MSPASCTIALATPTGESFPLTSLAAQERDFAAGLLVRTVPELLPESRIGDLDTAIADCVRLLAIFVLGQLKVAGVHDSIILAMVRAS